MVKTLRGGGLRRPLRLEVQKQTVYSTVHFVREFDSFEGNNIRAFTSAPPLRSLGGSSGLPRSCRRRRLRRIFLISIFSKPKLYNLTYGCLPDEVAVAEQDHGHRQQGEEEGH